MLMADKAVAEAKKRAWAEMQEPRVMGYYDPNLTSTAVTYGHAPAGAVVMNAANLVK
jgi:hypothetical protein